jgi:hypothetical protein
MVGVGRIAVIGAGALFAAVLLLTASPVFAQATDACTTPTWRIVVDPAHSQPMAPRVVIRAQDLATPADGRFYWGNGRFGITVMDTPDGGDTIATFQPAYEEAGTYNVRLDTVDACGAEWHIGFELRVPLVLPPPAVIACPGRLEREGLCVVVPAVAQTFDLEDTSDGPDDWRWTSGENPDSSTRSAGNTYRLTLEANDRTYLQATRRLTAGWAVTPPLLVVAQASQRESIVTYIDPGRVTTDVEVPLGFTSPADASAATPAILVDGYLVAVAATANVRLAQGDHDVAYELRYPDGQVVRRQIVVTASAAAAPIGMVMLATLGAALTTFVVLRRRASGGTRNRLGSLPP